MSEEQENLNNEELLSVEKSVLNGILSAAKHNEEDITTIQISREGKVYFEFDIRGLSEKMYNDLHDEATKFKKAKNMGGIKVPEETDAARFRSLLIYHATIKEDRKKLWDNKEAWDSLGVINAHSLIDKVLRAGEKNAIVDKIDEISGYGDETDNIVKNSSTQEED